MFILKVTVLPADTFVCLNQTLLSDQDRKIIMMLYQPIIGANAVSLYFTLWSYLDKGELFSLEWTHHHLMTNMGLKLEDIIEARERLEAIGLLKTFLKKDHVHNFVYQLYSPLSPSEFINNPILGVALYGNVGEREYEKILSYFKMPKINLKEYEEITCLFTDVFDAVPRQKIDVLESIYRRKNKQNIVISKIDLDEIISTLPEEYLNIRSITKDIKDLIYKLVFIYHLSDDHLLHIIRNSITPKRTIDRKLLRENARRLYKFENEGGLPTLIYKNQPEYLKQGVSENTKRAKMIYYFENMSPYSFLSSKYKGGRPPKAELVILEYLAVDLSISPGVINVIVDYVLKINNHKLTKNFVIAIAAQFKKAGIETVESAMMFAEKEYKGRKKITRERCKKIEKPTWFDQKIEAVTPLEKEKKELETMLEGFR